MSIHYTAESISRALFHTDPMHTCCAENDCSDEYDAVARSVSEHLQSGEALEHAFARALGAWFYDDEDPPVQPAVIRPVIEWLEKEGRHHE